MVIILRPLFQDEEIIDAAKVKGRESNQNKQVRPTLLKYLLISNVIMQ